MKKLSLLLAAALLLTALTGCASGNNDRAAVEWTLDEAGTLTVTGSGAMPDLDDSAASPWYELREEVVRIVISEGITAVGNRSFRFFDKLEELSLPATLKRVGDGAFGNCPALAALTLPEGLQRIGKSAFAACSSLTEITVPGSVRTIGEDAFALCSGVTSVELREGVKEIGTETFLRCVSLKSITLPASMTTVGEGAFEGCTKLVRVEVAEGSAALRSEDGILLSTDGTLLCCPAGKGEEICVIPEGVRRIGMGAFSFNASLREIVFPTDLREIGSGAFSLCPSLHTITLPASLKRIDPEAFEGCGELQHIYYLGSREQWERLIIGGLALPAKAALHFPD